MNIPKKYEDVVALLNEALAREAELREELELLNPMFESTFDAAQRDRAERDALQQRLTATERYVQKMVDCSKGQDSIATGYLADILDAIKGNK